MEKELIDDENAAEVNSLHSKNFPGDGVVQCPECKGAGCDHCCFIGVMLVMGGMKTGWSYTAIIAWFNHRDIDKGMSEVCGECGAIHNKVHYTK